MAYTRQHTGNIDTLKRRQEAEAVLARIETIPLGLEARAQLVASTANSKILNDTALSPLSTVTHLHCNMGSQQPGQMS